MGRECKVVAAAGKKGCGKSVTTIKMLDEIVRGNPASGILPRKVLILDVNNEFSDFWFFNNPHRRISPIAIKDVQRFAYSNIAEIRRIRPFFDNNKPMTLTDIRNTLSFILSNFRGGTLLVEDPTKYIGDNIKDDIIGALATCRHLSVDVILHYQSIGKVGHPKLFANTNYVRLHKTSDSVSRHEDKFQEKTELFQIAENIVNYKFFEENKKRFFLFIDNDDSKIYPGDEESYTSPDIDRAIEEYVSTNRNSLIKPLLVKIDLETGNLLFDEKTAIKFIKNRLRKTYFS